MIKIKNEAKTMKKKQQKTKHISCDFKCKFNSATCNSKQEWRNKTC